MNEHVKTAIRELMVANRILGNEGVVDAFGHISVRHPDNPARYFLACSRSPGLVTEDDVVEFDLDSNQLDGTCPRDLRRALHPRLPLQGAARRHVGVS